MAMVGCTHDIFEFLLDLLGGEFLAGRGFPEQHITVVSEQLRALGLRVRLGADALVLHRKLQPEHGRVVHHLFVRLKTTTMPFQSRFCTDCISG